MATYCEKHGYQLGDRFIVTGGDNNIFTRGSLVELSWDDGSSAPAFKLLSGTCYFDNASDASGTSVAGGFIGFHALKKVYSVTAGAMNTGIGKAYKSVHKLNTAFGRFEGTITQAQRTRQLELIREELVEGIDAVEAGNLVEEIDAACDLFVTVAGYMQQLERMGCNMQEALKRVCENNMSKLISSDDVDEMNKTTHKYKADGFDVLIDKSALQGYVVAKNPLTGKALKPASFVAVNIADCIPV